MIKRGDKLEFIYSDHKSFTLGKEYAADADQVDMRVCVSDDDQKYHWVSVSWFKVLSSDPVNHPAHYTDGKIAIELASQSKNNNRLKQ